MNAFYLFTLQQLRVSVGEFIIFSAVTSLRSEIVSVLPLGKWAVAAGIFSNAARSCQEEETHSC